MNRKDGTTKIFKMFLGDVLFKGGNTEKHEVEVRCIQFSNPDPEYNEVRYDFRGNVQYSTMISKLCDFALRTEAILTILGDLFVERGLEDQQVMLLAHNRNVLTYMHDAVAKRGIAGGSVGYYVGGMKEAALKLTESKKVVLATYAMAQEALDIKSLTTLIMCTPKTDIEQAVGRILRQRHAHINPVVVDMVDTHEPLKAQWKKRVAFYKKQQYVINYTTFSKYKADRAGCWETIYNPSSSSSSTAKKGCHQEDLGLGTNDDKQGWMQGKCLLKLATKQGGK
jgi:superfamily II DNA or RNA helicase